MPKIKGSNKVENYPCLCSTRSIKREYVTRTNEEDNIILTSHVFCHGLSSKVRHIYIKK